MPRRISLNAKTFEHSCILKTYCAFQEFFCIRGAYLIKRFVLSPYEVLTGLKRLDIGCMDELEFVLIQVFLSAMAFACILMFPF